MPLAKHPNFSRPLKSGISITPMPLGKAMAADESLIPMTHSDRASLEVILFR